MGLFSSIFGAKTTSKATLPSYLKGPIQGYSGAVGNYLKSDPTQYVAPASGLQNLAFDQASKLGEWRSPMGGALDAVKAAGSAPAASAGQAAQTAPAAQGTAAGYAAPQIGKATQAAGVNIAPVSTMTGASLLDNLGAYMDPATNALVDTTMADFNRSAAQQRASEQAKLAGQGSWGSGNNFYMSNFDTGNLVKGANLENQLRSQAYTQGINASNLDAGRRQEASGFNAGAANTRAGMQSGFDLQKNLFNADATNQFKAHQGDLNAQAGQFNAGQQNQMGMFNAGQTNNLGMFNTAQTNEQNQFNAGLENAGLGRSLQAAGMQGDIANSMAGNARGDTALVGSLGDMQHQIDQAMASALPTQLLNAGQMFNPLLGNLVGKTGTESPSPFKAALSVASLFSDRRLKRDITEIGKARGLKLYTYRYLWDDLLRLGVMAQEVLARKPEAVGSAGGFMTVNYGAI